MKSRVLTVGLYLWLMSGGLTEVTGSVHALGTRQLEVIRKVREHTPWKERHEC